MNTNEVMRELDKLDAATGRRAMTDTTPAALEALKTENKKLRDAMRKLERRE